MAAQHAEQRLAAIERLEAREREFRAEHAEHEDALRARVRDLERELADTRAVALRRIDEMARQVQAVHQEVSPGPVRRFARRSLRAGLRLGRHVVREGPHAVAPAARQVVHRLPDPARDQLRRVRRSSAPPTRTAPPTLPAATATAGASPAVTAPGANAGTNAGATGAASTARSAARSTARSVTRRLPPPAAARIRVTLIRVRRARSAPVPTAKRAVRRLPAPAQDAGRLVWVRTAGMRRRGRRVIRASGRSGTARRPAPKGRPYGEWKDGFRALVRTHVPAGTPWLVVAPGSPTEVRNAGETRALRFPDPPRRGPADDLALVAHLEALRYRGHRFLVVPEGSRPWFRRQAEFRDHVVSTYRCVADQSGAGVVFDLGAPADATASSLRHEIQRLAAGGAHDPAVLAWTDLAVDGELPGVTIFRPPAGTDLPYLDDSVEIVVRDDLRDRDEARRVATLGVVTVASAPDGLEVRSVEDLTGVGPGPAPTVLVRAGSGGDEAWTRELAARVADEGADLELGPLAADAATTTNGHDVVVLVEPFVLPLPGAIRAAAALAAEQPDVAITGKVLRRDGRLDSAGGTVFLDRSVALDRGGLRGRPGAVARLHAPRLLGAGAGRGQRRAVVGGRASGRRHRPHPDARVVRRDLGARPVRGLRAGSRRGAGGGLRRRAVAAAPGVGLAARAGPAAPATGPARRRRVAVPPRARRRRSLSRMTQRRALVVHTRMPAFDRDSGSQDVDNMVQFLLRAGWKVTFVARGARGRGPARPAPPADGRGHACRLRRPGPAAPVQRLRPGRRQLLGARRGAAPAPA